MKNYKLSELKNMTRDELKRFISNEIAPNRAGTGNCSYALAEYESGEVYVEVKVPDDFEPIPVDDEAELLDAFYEAVQSAKSDDSAPNLGTRIRQAREFANLSQQALADKIGVARPRVAEWEADKHEPAASRIKEIADVTGVTVNFLLGDFPRMPTTWAPLIVIPTTDDTPKTAEEACRLIRSESDMDYELSYVEDDIKVGWITFESGALVVWHDGNRDPDADLLYDMLVR